LPRIASDIAAISSANSPAKSGNVAQMSAAKQRIVTRAKASRMIGSSSMRSMCRFARATTCAISSEMAVRLVSPPTMVVRCSVISLDPFWLRGPGAPGGS